LIGAESIFAINHTDDLDYGLYIKADPFTNLERTGLVLENNSPLKLDKETSISFNMYIRNEYVYGIIFRIITNQNENIDLMLTVNDVKHHPILVVKESAHTVLQEIVLQQWTPVNVNLSKTKNEIQLTYGESTTTVPYDLSKVSDIKVSFGACDIASFKSTDIASVNIKDIQVFNNGELKRYWKLKEYLNNTVLDSIANVPAIATNPQWLIDIRSTWKRIYSNKVAFKTQVAFDEQRKFYIVSPDSKQINVFDSETLIEDTIHVESGYIASNSPNMIIYDTISNNLITYNIQESLISKYSFKENRWSSSQKPITDPYLNNSAVYSYADQLIYSFGGYGYHKYSHDLTGMSPHDGFVKKSELMEISPRYSASTVIVDKTMYIFGGRGSKSGRQEILPRNYYDFYSVNLLMGQATKLWEESDQTDYFLPGENMIYDADNNCFYLFTSQKGGTLLKIETKKKGFEQMSFPIGENLDARYIYTNIYFSKAQQKLFAVIYKQMEIDEVILSIYSLNYPPLPITSLNQTPNFSFKNKGLIKVVWWSVCVLLFGYLAFLFWKKREKKIISSLPQADLSNEYETETQPVIEEKSYYNFNKSSVCLLNGFNVIDKDGNNITKQFTPILKSMFLLLLLNTAKEEKGIFGKKMIQLLWFDKDDEAAKNNRNVYLSKLRSIFETIGNMEIANKNGYWTIKLDEKITCDYTEAMSLLSLLKEDKVQDQTSINKLLELLLRGILLPNTEIDWLDNFKSDFSNHTVDILTLLSKKEEYKLDDELRLKIANTLFLHDSVNEEALYIKISILFNSGKKGIAKSVYNNFCKEYNTLLGTAYKYSLADVINRTNITH